MLSKCNLLFHERSPLMDLLICRAQGSRRQSELKFHAIHQTAISWHGAVGHITVQSYIKNSHSHLLLQWELHMAAITSIKEPLVNVNTSAHRQTHVDLQQPFEDIHNFTWLLQLPWSMSNIVADKKWEMYNAIFHACQHFTLPETKDRTNIGSKQMRISNVGLSADPQRAQSSWKVDPSSHLLSRQTHLSEHHFCTENNTS